VTRSWRDKLPRVLIGGLLIAVVVAIVLEVETEKDVGGTTPADIPSTTLESRTFVVGQGPRDVVFDGEKLWVAETEFGTVTSHGLDGQRLDTADVGGSPGTLVTGAGFIWALDDEDGSVTQLDPSANILRKFQVGVEPLGMEFLGDHLWITDPERGSVSQISLQGGLTTQLEIAGSPGAITRTPEQVLVVDGEFQTVTGIDPGGEVVGTFKYPAEIELDGFSYVPGVPTAFLSTPNALWIAFSNLGQVMRLTPAGTYTGLARIPTGLVSMAWVDDELWVASTDAGSITRISSDGTLLETHSIGGSPAAITYDGENAWVVDDQKNGLIMLLQTDSTP
jgi:hypothetical protein